MYRVIQSRKNIEALTLEGDKRATISFIIATPISGSGKRKDDAINLPQTPIKLSDVGNNREYNKVKNSIKDIFNSDKYCLIRTIFIAIAFTENNPAKRNMLQCPTNKKLMDAVYKAADLCKIVDRPCTVNNLIKLEAYFKHYQIMLIDESYKLTNKILYLNRQDKFNKYIYLLHTGDHFNVIEPIGSYLFKSYCCDICKKLFDHTEEHN